MIRFYFTIALLVLSSAAFCQQSSQKTYLLFFPVSKDDMWDMETDLPDVTESAITLYVGHFQYESNLFAFERPSWRIFLT